MTARSNDALPTEAIVLAPVVQTMDSAIRRINHYPLDSAIDFAMTYPLDSIYPADSAIHHLNNWPLVFALNCDFLCRMSSSVKLSSTDVAAFATKP